ncbi:MAG TPA: DUF1376 domain-containing protein [Steroidobacteraceae bacterium]|nr:DUF1376 domain-containing protein [Steroidobacteraceae bacterium]
MKQQLPYGVVFFGDFLRATIGWTLLERGALLMLMLTNGHNGPLPDDPPRLAAICGLSLDEFTAIWPRLASQLTQTAEGLVHEPTEAHRLKYLTYRQRQSEGGKKAMMGRWGCPECRRKPFDGRCLSCGYETPNNNVLRISDKSLNN